MSIDRTKYLFIGVDLHKHSHTAVLCNCFGDKIKTFKIQNTPLQFPLFLDKLNKHTDGKEVIFGLEDCRNNYNLMAANIKVSLHNLLLHHYPNYKAFFKDLESKTARHFFYKYPTPDLLKNVDEAALIQVLKEANNSIRKNKAQEILNAVEAAGYWENDYQEERNELIRSYINSLNRFKKEIKLLEQKLDMLIAETGYPLQTIDGVDTVLAATFIANIGDINRFPNSNKIAKIAGIAPIEHSSGETQKQYANKLGNRELNKAFYSLAL